MKGGNLLHLSISNSDTMKKFLLKIGFAIVCFTTLTIAVYFITHGLSEKTNAYNTNNGQIFVWGDSQMYQGLDVSFLSDNLRKRGLTSAGHGKGVYDFLVYEKNIPNNAICVVSFSEAAFFRNPLSDNNRTGLELSCLWNLYRFGCPLEECWRIMGLNNKSISYSAFRTNHDLFPYADSLVYPEPLPLWHSLFEEPKDWFLWKAKAYSSGIQHLFDKHSQIVIIQFPFDEQVESFAHNSINRHLSDSLKSVLIGEYAMKNDTIALHNDSLLMHDLSHMNEVGARMLSHQIADSLREDMINNRFFTVVIE